MSARRKINWRQESEKLCPYKRYEIFLYGALSAAHPERNIRPPAHTILAKDFEAGSYTFMRGMIKFEKNANPTEIVKRLKRDHELKYQERAAQGMKAAHG